ncbi:MAG: transcription-repair coupling factor [Oscillospiraceae bacterium]|nr:transcription-repair coupling factor [Oscillospiraceae bacterium]
MDLLLDALKRLPEFGRVCAALSGGKHAAVSGAAQINRSHLIAGLVRELKRPLLVVCQDDMVAQRTQAELAAFLGREYPVLPGRDLTFYDSAAVSRQWEQRRLRRLYDFAAGKTRLLIATWEALSLRTMPRASLLASAITLRLGDTCAPDALTARLLQAGYSRCDLVEGVGQFAVRGGILDVFSPSADNPIRLEFFGDELDTMGCFDPLTQRRTENLDQAVFLPVAETLPMLHPGGVEGLCEDLGRLLARQKRRKQPHAELMKTLEADREKLQSGASFGAGDRYMSLIYPDFATAADYLPADGITVFCDHGNLRRSADAREEDFGLQLDSLLQSGILAGELCDFVRGWEDVCASVSDRPALFLESFLASAFPETMQPSVVLDVVAKQLPSYGGNLEIAASDLEHYRKNGFRTLVLCGSRRRGEILKQYLSDRAIPVQMAFPATGMPPEGGIFLTDGTLPNGMEYPTVKLAVLTEGQLLNRSARRARPRPKTKATNRQKLNSFTDLTPGDLIVHEFHGIGRYVGMEQMKVDRVVKDYVKIEYQGTDVLYVPATQMDLIYKYVGAAQDSPVKLNKLGGDSWEKTKKKAKAAVKDLADGLIKLYAERKRRAGFAFAADTPWQGEFEDNFPFAETDDQLRCIAEVKGDMEAPSPMDRLLCGDVGFGKTEVALRAAMKAIMDSKQVAILVPTTVLAQQHYVTASKRFEGFPVNIDVLSRFRTPAQQRKTLQDLCAGSVDLIVGTHKLLQKDIVFKDLGLLIVDEEQRFGVTHKERLKELSRGVDVLTLSATPIPRTLNMALSGIRDMSTIEEPPMDRYPVQTFVLEQNEAVLDDAIRRELARGGQVYYLHNRVESIARCASALKNRHPGAEIAVAHGKMNEDELGDVMQRMSDGEVQILVCTTIIETGIDIPNVNTLIIEDADRLGLAQLHQIRGRVGRSSRHAFAYLTFRRGKVLTDVAEKRLEAIREYAEFGSGFKIAMRDLEIRGAGNLLGAEQSGHIVSVGYDMYLKLLEEAVLEEQGGKEARPPACTADFDVTANIDKAYVEKGEQRMDLYRRMAAIRSREDADDLLDEIVDRYGDPPKGVLNLIDVALLRAEAAQLGVTDLTQKGQDLFVTFVRLDFQAISAVCADPLYAKRLFIQPKSRTPMLRLRLRPGENSLKQASDLIRSLRESGGSPAAE